MGKFMGVDGVTLANGSTNLAVAGAVTIYTKAMRVTKAEYMSVTYQAVSASGAPDVKIEMQQASVMPTTEGSADANWVEGENVADIEANLITETVHNKAINPPVLPFIRFKITGNAGNPVDTVVTMKLNKQEDF